MNTFRLLTLFLLISVVFAFASLSFSAGGGISLDRINNYNPDYIPNWVEAGTPLVFQFGIYNNSGFPMFNVRGFFEIYSPDGALWQPIDGAWNPAVNWGNYFDGSVLSSEYSADGGGADTANFYSFNLNGPGFPNLSTQMAWTITTQVDASQVGKQLCLDSVKTSHEFSWIWSYSEGGLAPTWTGPHCFTIESDCCQNIRGDVNGDGVNSNIIDLSFLVDRIFRSGPPPPCALEADLNGDGSSANVGDLSYLVDIIYRGGPPGVSCP